MPGSGGLFDGLSVREVRRRDLPSTGMDRRFDGLDTRIDDLNRHVHVLHEDVIARIEASSDRHAVTRGEFYAAFADLQRASAAGWIRSRALSASTAWTSNG